MSQFMQGGERSETVADRGREQAQNAWARENSYNGNSTGGGWTNNGEYYQANSQSETVRNGTRKGSKVKDVQAYQPAFELKNHESYDERSVYYDEYLTKNTNLPVSIEEAIQRGWMSSEHNDLHTWDGEHTIKFLSQDGHKEAIFNVETGKPTVNHKNRETYNLYNPETIPGKILHTGSDMRFYFLYGTGRDDPTTGMERIFKISDVFKND